MTTTETTGRASAESVQDLGEYITTAIRGEITRTQGTATCLLTVISFVGTAASAGLASTARDQGIVTILVLASAALLLGGALISILLALRPRLPKDPSVSTGWPLIPTLTRDEYQREAADLAEFLRQDAVTLAGIAATKFRLIRRAYDLAIVGLPVLVLGVALWL